MTEDFEARYDAYLEERRKAHQAAAVALPETVRHLRIDDTSPIYEPMGSATGGACGDWVAVRWCGETPSKTRLGVLIGAIARALIDDRVKHDDGSEILVVSAALRNPAIYVPSLARVVFGMESWWGKIKSPDQLREITDEDIDGVWYVHALKALADAEQLACHLDQATLRLVECVAEERHARLPASWPLLGDCQAEGIRMGIDLATETDGA